MKRLLCVFAVVLLVSACQTAQPAGSRAYSPAAELRAHAVSFVSGDGTRLTGYL